MTPEAVLAVVTGIWPVYAKGDQVEIEILERTPSAPPVIASLGWVGDRWRVMVDAEWAADPERLLWTLAHELGHVVLGDAQRVGGEAMAEQHKRAFIGKEGLFTEYINSNRTERRADPAQQAVEDRADAWADEFAGVWWPVLDSFDSAIDKAIAQAIGRLT